MSKYADYSRTVVMLANILVIAGTFKWGFMSWDIHGDSFWNPIAHLLALFRLVAGEWLAAAPTHTTAMTMWLEDAGVL